MSNIVVLGAVFGDEGKGRVVHQLSKYYDWIIRFSGGANAGHTIYRDGKKYVHNLLPSFDWRVSTTKAFLGAGMVIDLEQLEKEIVELSLVDKTLPSRVYVDPDAFLVFHLHKSIDREKNGHIGATNRGIGPAYMDKVGRCGTRISDLLPVSEDKLTRLKDLGVQFKHALELEEVFKSSNLLFEGAQGIMIDLNHGTYPYVSCGNSTVSGIYDSGFGFVKIDKVYGVAKCYATKVGEGPFPTEIDGVAAEDLRQRGSEYGATTGRPRRIGWLDLPALKYAVKKGGIDSLIITKFDILNGMPKVPICTSYDKNPVCSNDFFQASANYEEIVGWSAADNLSELVPFIKVIEKNVGIPITHISYGTDEKDFRELKR